MLDEALAVLDRTVESDPDQQADATPQPSGGLWRRLGLAPAVGGAEAGKEFRVMAVLACATAVAARAPEALGIEHIDDPGAFYFRNITLLVFPMLAGYFAWKRRLKTRDLTLLALAFAAAAAFANFYPFEAGDAASGTDLGDTEALAALHLPILTWLLVGVAHAGGDWRDHAKRMDYVRFTGEWVLYYGLIAVAGQIFLGTAGFLFIILDIDVSTIFFEWLLPCGAAGAAVVAAWLAETRGGVLERIAPVLTSILSPLLALALLGFLVAAAVTNRAADMDRDMLIFFDLLLALVLGLVIYSTAVRNPRRPPGILDFAQLALVTAALLADVLMLGAIVGRLSDFGLTPNRVAALGENLVLMVNLAWSARLYFGFWVGRLPFASMERWQTGYAPVYALWAAAVVVAFPPLFSFA